MNPKESLIDDVKFNTNYGVLENFILNNFDGLLNIPDN